MSTDDVLEDDDKGQSGGEHVPVLGTQAVRIRVIRAVSVAPVLAGRRLIRTVLLAAHVDRVMARVELGQRAVDVADQGARRRVDQGIDGARYEVRRVGYHKGLDNRVPKSALVSSHDEFSF